MMPSIGTELYRERLIRALARELQVPLLVLDSSVLAPYVRFEYSGNVYILFSPPFKKMFQVNFCHYVFSFWRRILLMIHQTVSLIIMRKLQSQKLKMRMTRVMKKNGQAVMRREQMVVILKLICRLLLRQHSRSLFPST